jgi:ATP-binding cassette, subfamily B, bacterial HlyB/CyaB
MTQPRLGHPAMTSPPKSSAGQHPVLQNFLCSFGCEETHPDLNGNPIGKANSLIDIERHFELRSVQVGDVLLDSRTAAIGALQPNLLAHASDASALWLVCEGRVRLLAWDEVQQREVSVALLEAESIFGGEGAIGFSVPYRAVAASPGVVAYLAETPVLLQAYPAYQAQLAQQQEARAQLMFLKTQTDLGRPPMVKDRRSVSGLTSEQLGQVIPDLRSVAVPIGSLLAPHAALRSGHFWLAEGTVGGTAPPAIGQRFSVQEEGTIPADWIAQTGLQLYQLPLDHWAVSQIAPPSAVTASAASPVSAPAPGPAAHRSAALKIVPLRRAIAPQGSDLDTPPNVIAFPQPQAKRRGWPRLWRRYPMIEQQSSSDCGVACLAMVSQYWGRRYPLHQLRSLARVGRTGATLKNLAATAEQLGFQAHPVRASLNRLAEQAMPWIAHWQGDHYVVVYRVGRRRVIIADPALGQRRLTKAEFTAGWTGYGLLLEPTSPLKPLEATKAQSLGGFGRLLVTYRSVLVQIILLSVLMQMFGLITPLFTQLILDQVVVQRSTSALNLFSIGLVIFSVWKLLLSSVRQYLLDYFSNRLDLTLVTGFISHTLRLPLKFFEDRNVGDILTRVQENTKIQQFLVRQAVSTWLDACTAVVYVGLMFYYNWQLTLLVLALIPPLVLLTLGATPFLKKISRDTFGASATQTSLLVEMMSGIATIKSAATEQEIRWRWEDKFVNLLNIQFSGQKLSIGLKGIGGLINAIGTAGLLWYGAGLVIDNQLSIGQLVAFNMLIGSVLEPILAVVGVWGEFQEVVIAVERLNDVFVTAPEEATGNALVLPPLQGQVQFDDVTFAYDGGSDHHILQNLSFTVAPGQKIAIVGRSGSGKSTLVKLLQGMYQTTQGRILVDGHDIHHVSLQSLRTQMGVVPQECFLFSGTIEENIQLYRPNCSIEDVIAVAKLAEAHPFIQDLPLGYSTKVGERGTNLSGGQRQRIAIARALLGNPAMLVLDEATSALDTESERRFQHNLERISRDRTTFIIAHRLSTVQNADRILVLDRGLLVEQGSHQELLKMRGIYYHLAQQQLTL